MADRDEIRRGQIVFSSDGRRLGRVVHCDDSGFVVERGLVFAQDYPVFYEEVASASADEVRLRLPADALLPEELADAWDPPRDPEGTDGGIDLEPLRAGMAEIDEGQRRAAEGIVAAFPRREDERARRAAMLLALYWGEGAAETPVAVPAEGGILDLAAASRLAAELGQRIVEELEDFEREGACALQTAPARLRAGAAVRRRRAAARARATREDRGAATGRGAPATPPVASRLDYGRSAPDAVSALRQLETYVRGCGLEPSLLELIRLRASQLNGCAPCIDLHHRNARRAGETKERLDALATWSETPLFTPRERAALAWSEAVTRVGIAHVDDATYALAREQFDERELVNLTMAAVAINGWNRLAVAFRVEPGTYQLGLG